MNYLFDLFFGFSGRIPRKSWWLAAAVLTWVAGFDLIYACQDEGFDREAELLARADIRLVSARDN